MDVTPPLVFMKIQVMKEPMEVMMNALKGRVSNDLDDLVNRTDSSFTAAPKSFVPTKSQGLRSVSFTKEPTSPTAYPL